MLLAGIKYGLTGVLPAHHLSLVATSVNSGVRMGPRSPIAKPHLTLDGVLHVDAFGGS